MMYFYQIDHMPYQQKREGVWVKVVSGENVQLLFVKLDPGFVSDHHHPHEQMGQIISGEVEVTIAGKKRVCTTGDLYYIPANTPHSFKVLSGQPAELMDIFSPPKAENVFVGTWGNSGELLKPH